MQIDIVRANAAPRGAIGDEHWSRYNHAASPGTEVRLRLPTHNITSITGHYEDALCVPEVVENTITAAREGADAVVIDCTADTGLAAAREAVSIPVIGVTEAAFHLSAQLAHRFSVLTFAESIAPRFETMARAWGLSHKLASVRSVEIPLETADDDELVSRLVTATQACANDDGAHLVILGCTAFEILHDRIRHEIDGCVPLVRPFLMGFRQAESLVSMRLSHSKRTYPTPTHRNPQQ